MHRPQLADNHSQVATTAAAAVYPCAPLPGCVHPGWSHHVRLREPADDIKPVLLYDEQRQLQNEEMVSRLRKDVYQCAAIITPHSRVGTHGWDVLVYMSVSGVILVHDFW